MTDDDNLDREKLLANFLADIDQRKIITGSQSIDPGNNALDQVSMDDYPVLEIPEEVEEKIQHLQKISTAIDIRPPVTVDTSLLKDSLKVDYLKSLNDQQLAAVVNINGPVMVIAGAGTGKTRVIVYRVASARIQGSIPILPDS